MAGDRDSKPWGDSKHKAGSKPRTELGEIGRDDVPWNNRAASVGTTRETMGDDGRRRETTREAGAGKNRVKEVGEKRKAERGGAGGQTPKWSKEGGGGSVERENQEALDRVVRKVRIFFLLLLAACLSVGLLSWLAGCQGPFTPSELYFPPT